jgi:hypothetical protein
MLLRKLYVLTWWWTPGGFATKDRPIAGPDSVTGLNMRAADATFEAMLKAAGVSDAIARAIVGHESAAVSRAYTHLDMETMRKALEKMADFAVARTNLRTRSGCFSIVSGWVMIDMPIVFTPTS